MTLLKRILVAVIGVPILFVVLVFLPSVATAILCAVICGFSCFELLRAAGAINERLPMTFAVISAVMIPLAEWLSVFSGLDYDGTYLFAFVLFATVFFAAIKDYQTEKAFNVEQLCIYIFGGVIIPQFISAIVRLRTVNNGVLWAVFPFVVAFVSDGGAYFAGVFLGKHRGITKVSPNKSLEGFLGGIVSGLVLSLVYALIIRFAVGIEISFPLMALYGLLGGLITEVGDLAFSFMKREFNIKDFGNLLPGHGGMLDRFDSMVFCAPLILILSQIIPAF